MYDDVGHLPTRLPAADGLNDEVETEDTRARRVRRIEYFRVGRQDVSRRVFSRTEERQFRVTDEEAMTIASGGGAGPPEKCAARPFRSGDVGAPMPGVVVDVKVGEATSVQGRDAVCPVGDEDGVHDRAPDADDPSVLCAIGDAWGPTLTGDAHTGADLPKRI